MTLNLDRPWLITFHCTFHQTTFPESPPSSDSCYLLIFSVNSSSPGPHWCSLVKSVDLTTFSHSSERIHPFRVELVWGPTALGRPCGILPSNGEPIERVDSVFDHQESWRCCRLRTGHDRHFCIGRKNFAENKEDEIMNKTGGISSLMQICIR